MEVTNIVVHTLSLDEVEGEKADGSQDACIIEVETDEGITGIGEADSSPAVVRAVVNAPISHDKSKGLKHTVVGRNPFDVEAIWNDMYEASYFYGRKGAALNAMSGIDIALWDIMGKATGRPLYELLGGKHRDEVRAYASTLFPADPSNTDHMRREARRAQEDGFTAIKFGWGGFGEDRHSDVELVGAARDELGRDFDIMIDAGMAWQDDLKGGIKTANAIDRAHDVFWVEEPVFADNTDGYRRFSRACETRIVGGEEEYATYGFRDFIEHGEVDGVQPDVARSGGVTHMNKIATLAAERGIPLYPHGYSTDIIIAANLHLIAANRNAPLLEYCIEDSPLRWDVVTEDFPVKDGVVSVPDDPGLGVTLNRETLDRYRTEH
jgi:L-alanine-DL-glutamate epimerase-like enolase superfamily enzyme